MVISMTGMNQYIEKFIIQNSTHPGPWWGTNGKNIARENNENNNPDAKFKQEPIGSFPLLLCLPGEPIIWTYFDLQRLISVS